MVTLSFLLMHFASGAWATTCPQELSARRMLCAPSASEQLALNGKISDVVSKLRQFEEARRQERMTRESLVASGRPSEPSFNELRRWKFEYDQAEARRKEAEDAMRETADLVQASYGIVVDDSPRTIANGPFRGKTVRWSLEASTPGGEATVAVTPSGERRYFVLRDPGPDERVAAVTREDGSVALTQAIFQIAAKNGPSALAQAILHESVHFESLTRGGWKSMADEEANAYGANLSAATELEVPHELRTNTLVRFVGWNGARILGKFSPVKAKAPFLSDEAVSANRRVFESEVEAIRAGQDRLSAQLAVREEERNAGGSAAGEGPNCGGAGMTIGGVFIAAPPCVRLGTPVVAAPELPPTQAVPVRPAPSVTPVLSPNRFAVLNEAAASGCRNPLGYTQEDLNRLWTTLRGLLYRPEVAFEMGLSGCQRTLFLRLMALAADGSSVLTIQAFSEMANEARTPPPPAEDLTEPRFAPTPPNRPRCRYMGDWCN